MGFHNVVLDNKFLGRGSVAGPGHNTLISETPSGVEERVIRMPQAKRRYDLSNRVMGYDDISELQSFVIQRQGAAHTFLIQDPLDYTTNPSDFTGAPAGGDVVLGQGNGTRTQFQMVKRYGDNTEWEQTRDLRRIQPGTAIVQVDGVTQILTTQYTIDELTGSVNLTSAPVSGASVTAGCKFYTEVRFDLDLDTWMQNVIEGAESGSISAPMVEQKDPTPTSERLPFQGGYTDSTPSGVTTVPFGKGRAVIFVPTSALDVRLPNMVDDWPGAFIPWGFEFIFLNAGTGAITLKERRSGSWLNLQGVSSQPSGRQRRVVLFDDKSWRAM